ncbi:MAG: aldehyde dehydrogenase family protein [Ilumatobacteraceae bacterium]
MIADTAPGAATIRSRDDSYIDGQWVASTSAERCEVIDPSTEEVIGSVPAGSAADIDVAIDAARAAFDGWAALTPVDRAAVFGPLGPLIDAHAGEFIDLIVAEEGIPFSWARDVHVGRLSTLVPHDRVDAAAQIAADASRAYVPGPPADPDTRLGPVANANQYRSVLGFIRAGIDEGATLVCGGPERPAGLDRGYFVQPTVFSNVDPDMTIAQHEIFGPVLSIIGYTDTDDAIRIANNSRFGLSGAVWASSDEEAVRVARQVRTGQVQINTGVFNGAAPFGGFKKSGTGRENGRYGMLEFTEVKSVQLPADSPLRVDW